MLLSETVIMKWHHSNKKWYESKGYIYTKMGDEFEVKIEDLSDGSSALVEIKCDNPDCTTPINKPITWQSYIKYKKEDDKYYCVKCASNLYGKEKTIKTKLANSISFEQWCIENNRQDILNRWDYELNKCKPSEIGFSSMGINKKGYYFKCPKGIHPSELKNIISFTHDEEGAIDCKMCNSFTQYGIDNICSDFLEKYWDYDKNIGIDPWKIDYSSNKIFVYIKCQEKDYHESYKIKCNDFVNGRRCSYCGNFKVHPLDSLGKILKDKNLLDIWSDKNKKSPYEYTSMSNQYVWWKCIDDKHKDYYKRINSSNQANFNCPNCSRERDESYLQEKVRLYLESLNDGKYIILHEYKCTIIPQNPKVKSNNKKMPFDNEVKELKLIIEVMGIQHYEITGWYNQRAKRNNTTPEYELYMQQVRDRYKRMYAKSKGYNYIAIPYWTDNKEETWKQLIDNKIKEIV